MLAHLWTFLGNRGWLAGLCCALWAVTAFAADPDPPGSAAADPAQAAADLEFFEKSIRPLLSRRCYECHGEDTQEAGLRLDRLSAALRGGESGPAIQPGQLDQSLIIRAVRYTNDFAQMPPDGKLPAEEIALLESWVKHGAPGPREPDAAVQHAGDFNLAERKQHWCFQPVRPAPLPAVQDTAWPRADLDRFLLARLEQAGLAPAEEADRATWLRRVTFDLIGLPPTPEELALFLADRDPQAHSKVVDRLLASPHYGERWARHWLDLVRYAETLGHEFDYPLLHAAEYRDYVIRAFNADVPYDQLVREHLAGDLLPQPRLHPTEGFNESIIGTGFWFLGEATHAPVDVRADETAHMDNQIDVMSKVFLGLTVACARCHDHKFDAITQRDYYALAGYLKSSRRQVALLDPGGKIAAAVAQIDALREKARALRQSARPAVDSTRLAAELRAAREVLFGEPTPADAAASGDDVVFEDFEAETLENWHAEGDAAKQALSLGANRNQMPVAGFEGKRLINTYVGTDGATGRLRSKPFRIERRFIRFLIGGGAHRDQTCVQLHVDGKVVRAQTGKNDERLAPAAWDVSEFIGQTATFEIVDQHTGGWGHINVDQIVFTDRADGGATYRRAIDVVAKEAQVEPARLAQWCALLSSPQAKQPSHPWFVWARLATVPAADFAAQRKALSSELERLSTESTKGAEASPLFADFNGNDWGPWRATGHAFGERPTAAAEWDPATGAELPAGAAHSGSRSKRLRGVLRSPSFIIEKPFIDYRIAGQNAQVRVIIDSYVMDVFNGLLFGGVSFPVNTEGQFIWQRQGGDYSRYIGHRAHLEFIDDSDGWIAIDEIRFSDGPQPPAAPHAVALRLASDERLASHDALEAAYAQAIVAGDIPGAAPDTLPELAALSAQVAPIEAQIPEPRRVIAITDGPGEDEFFLRRGNHKTPGQLVPRRFLEALGGLNDASPEAGSGRLPLAERIVAADNPLTARVAANRLWHHLFGRGIVASVDNFGVLGDTPSHPELLDYLALRLQNHGWSQKKLLKELVLSATYRQSSQPRDEAQREKAQQVDPRNLLLHRMNIKRLPGEIIRDALLAASGRLDPRQLGGSVATHLTPFMEGRGRPGGSGPLDGDGRRSIYLEVRRNFLNPMFLAFDFPIPFNSISRRTVSNVPAQALILMNDPLVVSQSRLLAQRLLQETPPPERSAAALVEQIYLRLYARPPSGEELTAALDFVAEQQAQYQAHPWDERVWGDLVHVLVNVKEFIFIR